MIGRTGVSVEVAPERAFLIGVAAKRSGDRYTAEASLEELAQLVDSAGASVVGKAIQRLPKPSQTHYIGKGKIEELLALKESVNYNVVIFDDELSPLQQRSLEESLKVKILDRVALILDIFGRRARTHEGKLQVELAQHQYLLPRLTGQWSHLERLGGGIGTRGPGESQLETDRRLIKQKIQRLKSQLEEVRRHRNLYRQRRRRSGTPVVALVGYTNSGKSTLLNALCRSDVLTEHRLFSTLDPTTRRLPLPDNNVVLLTDTVGFIRRLPPTIVTAFRATLEELSEASLLIHVVDLASPEAPKQCQAVEDILNDLGLTDKPRITALNKVDLLVADEAAALSYISAPSLGRDENTVVISAVKGWGLDKLVELISQNLTKPQHPEDAPVIKI